MPAMSGVCVLDNGIVQAGTFPARLLADFGAKVIRVENYLSPDISRNVNFPDGVPSDPYWENGGTYHEQFRNKALCVGLDVKTDLGKKAYLDIVRKCDVVLDSHPPGVMERLGLDYQSLKQVKPDLVYVTTSGYGYGGPFSSIRSYGMMTELMCGSGWLNGYEGESSRRGACPLTDHPATFHIAFVLMAALIRRRKTGAGIWLDVSQYEVGINALGDAHLSDAFGNQVPARVGSRDNEALFSGCFPCAGTERWVAVSVSSLSKLEALAKLIGVPVPDSAKFGAESMRANGDSFARALRSWTEQRSTDEVTEVLAGLELAVAPVNDVRDLLLDQHLADRDFFWLVEHAPEQHTGSRAWPGASAKLSSTPARLYSRAPMLGEHNRHVAIELLGYSDDEFGAMEAAGAFGTVPRAAAAKPMPQNIAGRLSLGRSATGRVKEVDKEMKQKLIGRFGPAYGGASEINIESEGGRP